MEKAENEHAQQWAQAELKIMNTALKEMRTVKKDRENCLSWMIREDLTVGQSTDVICRG